MDIVISPNQYRKYAIDGKLQLSNGFFQRYFESDGVEAEVPILQVSLVKKVVEGSIGYPHSSFRIRLSDGTFYYSGLFLANHLEEQCIRDNLLGNAENGGEIIAVTKVHMNLHCMIGKKNDENSGSPMLIINGYELLSRGHPILSLGVSHDGNKNTFANFSPVNSYHVDWNPCIMDNVAASSTSHNATSSKMLQLNSADVSVTPISMLTPYMGNWRICGVCTSKEELKKVRTRTGEDAAVFSFELTDKVGAAIRLSGFNDAAMKAFSIIRLDRSYYISGGRIKQANKQFNTTGHEYEVTVTANTEAPNHKDECIDVLAVVDEVEPVNKFTSRQGRKCVKRDISLVDQSCAAIRLTLWNDQAENFDDHILGHVISIKGALVKEWNGIFSLAVTPASKMDVNPMVDEVSALSDWYVCKRRKVDVKAINVKSGGNSVVGYDVYFIGTIVALQLGNEAALPNGRYISLKAMITAVRTETALYKSCPNNGCSKKVVQQSDELYRCAKCDMSMSTFKWSFMVQVELTDLSGSVWITLFSNVASKLFGMDAQELGAMKENNEGAYNHVLTSVCFKYFNWRINARTNMYNDEVRMRYVALACDSVPFDRYIALLKDTAKKLEDLDQTKPIK